MAAAHAPLHSEPAKAQCAAVLPILARRLLPVFSAHIQKPAAEIVHRPQPALDSAAMWHAEALRRADT